MTPTPQSPRVVHGDCLEIMKMLPDCSVDSIVTDPPYGLGFMGKAWDALPPGEEWAAECLRVLKPGGHLLAFGGSRTWHRLAVAVEDAGFEIRDSIAWLYGSGFPKSLDVSKAIDKAAGAERKVIGTKDTRGVYDGIVRENSNVFSGNAYNNGQAGGDTIRPLTAPATPAAEQWQGWVTALKPAFEPVVVGRKPLIGTVAANVQAHGTGALNIDGCRIGTTGATTRSGQAAYPLTDDGKEDRSKSWARIGHDIIAVDAGRWPANVALDETTAAMLDEQSGNIKDRNGGRGGWQAGGYVGGTANSNTQSTTYKGEGGASRFFMVAESDESGAISPYFPREFDPPFLYSPKAPKKERPKVDGIAHPTVKPLALMRWLVRLVTPEGGTVLEPFAGSGATVEACILEGFHCIAIERESEYLPLIQARIDRQDAA